MAAWQVDFAIVPRRAIAASPELLSSRAIDADWWKAGKLPSDYARRLATIAPPVSSAASDLQTGVRQTGTASRCYQRTDEWLG